MRKSLGMKIRDKRVELGYTQAELCGKIRPKMHQPRLSAIETGDRSPTLRTLERITRALKCKVADLL